ncbi:MAG: HAD family hydrolase [Bacillota bacterium]
MDIKAVVFDLDGTLADTVPLTIVAIKEIVRELTGKELSDDDVSREFGPVDTQIVRNLLDEQNGEKGVELYVRFFSEKFNEFVKPIDGIYELIKYLRETGIKVGLFTGRGLRVSKIILEKLNLSGFFDVVLSGDDTTKPKPDPEGILKVLEKLCVSPHESVYTGDFEVDVLASKAAGVTSVLALWSSTASEELKNLNPDKSFESPYDFIEWVKTVKIK